MPKRTKTIYPKSISKNGDRFLVTIYSKQLKKDIHIGRFDTIESAIEGRDKWLVDNYNLADGYLPRGIAKSITIGRFRAQFTIGSGGKNVTISLGTFLSLEEAVEARKNYILSLL